MNRLFTITLALALLTSSVGAATDTPAVTPPPRHVEWAKEAFQVRGPLTISTASDSERQVGEILGAEMQRLHGISCTQAPRNQRTEAQLVLALASSARGKELLSRTPAAKRYDPSLSDEIYLLEVTRTGARIVAETSRGLAHGVQTLLQLVQANQGSRRIAGVGIVDYPQLKFRGLHICIFPNTELAAVRQAILVAARFKYNAVVLETWASLQSKKRPETAYRLAYSPEQIKPLIELGKALQMDMIPMLNSWGHASGMRANSAQHVVLDRFPHFKPLYEEDGWSFCLTNPAIYDHLFDRFSELLELFENPKYFHLGLDEAWGHRGLMASQECRGENPRAVLTAHMNKLYGYFAERGIRVFVWHDMFIQRDHPELGRLSPANSVPPFDSHLVLDQLPKDIIMDTWNYSATNEWPVPKYFQDRGFPVVVSPWKVRKNALALVNTAKRLNVMGLLETTWDSLDVTLPTVGEAGVASWTEPGFNVDTIDYEEFLKAIRDLPICDLPVLEKTLHRR